MHYKVKKAKIEKDGINLTVADSNVSPLYWYESSYHGTLAEFLFSIHEGNFKLYSNINSKLIRITRYIERISGKLDKNGLTFEEQFRYGLNDRTEIMQHVCQEYADRYFDGRQRYEDPVFVKALAEYVEAGIEKGLQNIARKREEDKRNGKIRITSAAWSLFEGYDLLFPYEGEDGPILAPKEDYKLGILTVSDPAKIVYLGKEADDLYAFLSFSGLNMTLEEYISKCPHKEAAIRDKFSRADKAIEKALNAGLKLSEGARPYIGYEGSKKNTQINYLYRDASNYKNSGKYVVKGTLTKDEKQEIIDCCDMLVYFIPEQVGIPSVRFADVTEDDHCWHEMSDDGDPDFAFEETDKAPTDGTTAQELLAAFRNARGNWNDVGLAVGA